MKRAIVLLLILVIVVSSMPALAAPVDPGADLIPDTYAIFINLAGRDLPARLAKLRTLLGLHTNDETALMQSVTGALFPGAGINYANDIAPWLGEHIAIGFNDEDDFVMLAATTDPALSDRFVQKLDAVLLDESFTVTGLEGYVAYGSAVGIQQVVEVMDGEREALAGAAGMQQTFGRLPVDRFAAVYIDGEAIEAFFVEQGIVPSMVLGENTLTGVGAAASMQPGSPGVIRFDAALGFGEPVPAPVASTSALGVEVEKIVPSNALALFAAYDLRIPVRAGLYAFSLQSYVQSGIAAAAEGEKLPNMPSQEQAQSMANGLLAAANLMLRETGLSINLEKDVLDWLSGEYAVGLLPNPGGLWNDPRFRADVFFVAQVIDQNAARNIVEIFSRVLDTQFDLTPSLVNIEGYDLRSVPDPATGANLFIFGLIDNFLVVATGDSIQQFAGVASGSAPNLAGSAAWQARAKFIEPGSEALLYVPVAEARGTLGGRDMLSFYEFAVLSVDVVEETGVITFSAVAKVDE